MILIKSKKDEDLHIFQARPCKKFTTQSYIFRIVIWLGVVLVGRVNITTYRVRFKAKDIERFKMNEKNWLYSLFAFSEIWEKSLWFKWTGNKSSLMKNVQIDSMSATVHLKSVTSMKFLFRPQAMFLLLETATDISRNSYF